MSWPALAVFLLVTVASGNGSSARAAAFVSDVSVVDGLGTVTVDAGPRRLPQQWITRDGGRTFDRLEVGGRSVARATVLANGLGYATARDGRLWRTVDGGRNWRATAVKDVFQITATSTSAWALRTRGRRVWLVRSEDGGRTWHTRALHAEGPAVRVAFADAADGVMTGLRPRRSGLDGDPFLLVTRDGGRTWAQRRDPCSPDAVGFKAPADVQWLASGTLWLVCVGAGGVGSEPLEVHTSLDAGRSFTLQSRAPLPGVGAPAVGRLRGAGHYHGFSAVTNRRAFMRFGYGLTVTRDAGRHWRSLRHLPRELDGGVSGLSVDGRTRYLALGADGLWRSPDAGAHWRRVTLATK